jgi:hypothetical protein
MHIFETIGSSPSPGRGRLMAAAAAVREPGMR